MTPSLHTRTLDPITLPDAEPAPQPRRWPFIAAVVPVFAGIALWLVTGSLLSLVFAALGPLMIAGNALDGARVRRKHERLAGTRRQQQWARASDQLDRAHAHERGLLLNAHPDVSAAVTAKLLVPEAAGPALPIVLGRGEAPSAQQLSMRDESDEARAFVARSQVIADAPVCVPLATAVHIVGPDVTTLAVARGLVAQVLLRVEPGSVAFRGDVAEALGVATEHGEHVIVLTRQRDAIVRDGESLWLVTEPGGKTPAGIGAMLAVDVPTKATLVTRTGTQHLIAEALSQAQFAELVRGRGATAGRGRVPERVLLSELPRGGLPGTLQAAIGVGASGTCAIDLVADGPHAVVTGVTGTGKSELLCTWIASLARDYAPSEVTFVLADFKGGMAFAALRDLPHTAAVLTDLDTNEVTRGVQSLRAEMRRRSALLAGSGVRDAGGATALARLVIVVDEFAAMMHEHSELSAIFTDIAARGRALGIHLILGTQRATGAIRDALLANCPLRVCLRASDSAESRFVVGSDAAFQLPGGVTGRGLAEVRRASETATERVRIALTRETDLAAIAVQHAAASRAVSPWLPSLPTLVSVDELRMRATGEIVLGLSDNPTQQWQEPLSIERTERGLCIAGGVGSGKSTALAAIAQQLPEAVVVPRDPEAAWALMCGAARPAATAVVLCDDFDVRTAHYAPEQAAVWLAAWEQCVRRAAESGGLVVLTLSRYSTGISRVTDLLPLRAILGTRNRTEHLALGGTSETWRAELPVGRAVVHGLETQLAYADVAALRTRERSRGAPAWCPNTEVHALIAVPTEQLMQSLERDYPAYRVRPLADVAQRQAGERTIMLGDAEAWLRQQTLWQQVRAHGTVLIPATHSGLLRTLGGFTSAPPYARAAADRVWELGPASEITVARVAALSPPSAVSGSRELSRQERRRRAQAA